MVDFIADLNSSFEEYNDNVAFVIQGKRYSYCDLKNAVNVMQQHIGAFGGQVQRVGVICHDALHTYAALLAVMFSGKTFIPILPHYPESRNREIERTAKIDVVIDPLNLTTSTIDRLPVLPVHDNSQVLAILFTSGSTGRPKGVPYSEKNINATLDAYNRLGINLSEKDRFLQMFDLNFDMSYLSFLPALLKGASVYTVGHDGIKYLEAAKLMLQEQITVATMVPSSLHLLAPYFDTLVLQHLRYTIVGGEPFMQLLANDWYRCTPVNMIYNISGPTETTMACMGYWVPREEDRQKTHHGILAFGQPWPNTTALVLNDQQQPLDIGQIGELAFAGDNVMEGYWNLPEVNQQVFCSVNGTRFYKTGDMAFVDKDGIFHTCGRKDQQVKILGFKVELGEIEFHAEQLLGGGPCVAKYFNELRQLVLFVKEDLLIQSQIDLLSEMKLKVPAYMVPSRIVALGDFAYTNNGKIDKNQLFA